MSENNVNVFWQWPTSPNRQHFEMPQESLNIIPESCKFADVKNDFQPVIQSVPTYFEVNPNTQLPFIQRNQMSFSNHSETDISSTQLNNGTLVEHNILFPNSLQHKFVRNSHNNAISQEHLANTIYPYFFQPYQNITCPSHIHQPILPFDQILDLDSGRVVYPLIYDQKPEQTEPLPATTAPIFYFNPDLESEELKMQKVSEITEDPLAINPGTSNSNDYKKPGDFWCYICEKDFFNLVHLRRHFKSSQHKLIVNYTGVSDPKILPVNMLYEPNLSNFDKVNRGTEKLFEKVTTSDQQVPEQLQIVSQANFKNNPIVQQPFTVAISPNSSETSEASLDVTSVNSESKEFNKSLCSISETLPYVSNTSQNVNVGNVTSTEQNFINQNDAFLRIHQEKNCQKNEEVATPEATPQDINDNTGRYNGSNIIINMPFTIQHYSSINTVQGDLANATKVIFKCNECARTFNRSCYLLQHIAAHHSGDKPFRCTKCGKKFHNEHSLNVHSQKHVGNKAHRCVKCEKQFHYPIDLKRHFFGKHLGQKPFSCSFCEKSFMRNDHLAKHLAVHNKKGL